MLALIRSLLKSALACAAAAVCLACRPAAAQEPPPAIPHFVVDLHGVFPSFPVNQALADSRGLGASGLSELPGRAFGGDFAVHLYPFRWKAITFGIGARVMGARATNEPQTVPDQSTTLVAVTEKLTSIGPELSFNFGTGAGWSYLSGGISASRWSIIPKLPDGTDAPPQPPDEERLKTITYGGGARWFAKPHLAFSFDVRFYAINPSTTGDLPPSPRTTLLVIGAGVSIK
jgi:hypothetical protein